MFRPTMMLLALALTGVGRGGAATDAPPDARYAFGSATFGAFVADSYRLTGQNPADFSRWLTSAYASRDDRLPGHEGLGFEEAMDARARELAAARMPEARAKLELQTATWLHRVIKQTIPKFSLERGFEFTSAATTGERQCLLQSVLITSLLQKMGVSAGVDMVWANPQGQRSNMGHAVTVLRLSDGRDVLVDASDPTPFVTHQGLFARVGDGYAFLQPTYAADATITGYHDLQGHALKVSAVRPLDTAYLRSQFSYYRGERTPGGFFAAQKTPEGLANAARFFRTALKYNAQNPLATYALGQVLAREGQAAEARSTLTRALALYQRQGYVPQGPRDAYAAATKPPKKPGT